MADRTGIQWTRAVLCAALIVTALAIVGAVSVWSECRAAGHSRTYCLFMVIR